jgi:hypothetical protein
MPDESTTLYMIEVGSDQDSVFDFLDELSKGALGVYRDQSLAVREASRIVTNDEVRVVGYTVTRNPRNARIEKALKEPNPRGPGYVKKELPPLE